MTAKSFAASLFMSFDILAPSVSQNTDSPSAAKPDTLAVSPMTVYQTYSFLILSVIVSLSVPLSLQTPIMRRFFSSASAAM